MKPIIHSLVSGVFDFAPNQSQTFELNINCTGNLVVTGILPGMHFRKAVPADRPFKLSLSFQLWDPNGNLVIDFHPPAAGTLEAFPLITMAMLDQVRDLRGLIKQPWRLQITNGSTRGGGASLNVEVSETVPSSSGAPLVSRTGANSVTLAAGAPQTIPFNLNRLGNLQVNVGSHPNPSVTVSILLPSGSVVASGNEQTTYFVDLPQLYQAQKVSGPWGLQLQCSAAVTCEVTAQVYDTLAISADLLQTRLDAIFGGAGGNLIITTEYDSSTKDSFVCLTINDLNVVETFDSVGIIDSLEATDRVLRTLPGQYPPAPPAAPPALAKGIVYRILALGRLVASKHDVYLKNVQTSSIRVIAGGADNDTDLKLQVAVALTGSPVLDIDGFPDLELEDVYCGFDLVFNWVPTTKRITLAPKVTAVMQGEQKKGLIIGHHNWINAPDGFIDTVFGDADTLLQAKFNSGLQSLGTYLLDFVDRLLFQFMGGVFDFGPTLTWQNRTFTFQFVPGEEDPPGVLSLFYHPGGASEMNGVPSASTPNTGGSTSTTSSGTEVAMAKAETSATPSSHGTAVPITGATAAPTDAPTPIARVVPPDSSLTRKPNWISPNLSKIDHIVVLMKENRSFDHVLGYLSLGTRTDVDGLSAKIIDLQPLGSRSRYFPLVPVTADAPPDYFPFDPDHSYSAVANEINNPGGPPMGGFVAQFVRDYLFIAWDAAKRTANNVDAMYDGFEQDAVMGYHTPATVPYYDTLASAFTVCDRWFASHPGPTFPNRYFYLSGKLNVDRFGEPQLDNDSNGVAITFDRHRTLFDELTARGITWTFYESPPDVSMLRTFVRYAFDTQNIRPREEFFSRAEAGQLPSVTFIDPNFHYGLQTDDDHPPTSITAGQDLVRQIVKSLTSNHEAWGKTLFIITYDEHGSLYDHVTPPVAETLSENTRGAAPPITIGYGVRVPTFVISPWVEATCSHQLFDHCSILKTVLARFCPDDPPILSDRVAFAADVGPLLSLDHLPPNFYLAGNDVATAVTAPPSPTAPTTATAVKPAVPPRDMLVLTGGGMRPAAALPRAATLLSPGADWHNYIARLKQLVSP